MKNPILTRAIQDGAFAARDGLEFWENPHMKADGYMEVALAWLAGWCEEKRNLSKSQPQSCPTK